MNPEWEDWEQQPFLWREHPMLPFCKRNAEELGEDWAAALPEAGEPPREQG